MMTAVKAQMIRGSRGGKRKSDIWFDDWSFWTARHSRLTRPAGYDGRDRRKWAMRTEGSRAHMKGKRDTYKLEL